MLSCLFHRGYQICCQIRISDYCFRHFWLYFAPETGVVVVPELHVAVLPVVFVDPEPDVVAVVFVGPELDVVVVAFVGPEPDVVAVAVVFVGLELDVVAAPELHAAAENVALFVVSADPGLHVAAETVDLFAGFERHVAAAISGLSAV